MRSAGVLSVIVAVAVSASAAPAATVTVLAAASLGEAFREMAERFEATHPGDAVRSSFAGSSTLVVQLTEGAPADVVALADEASMERLVGAGRIAGTPRVFARNRLAIIVAPGNPKRVTGLADLTRGGVVVALAAPAVPAGRYAAEAFAKAGLSVPAASQEADVKAVVTRVVLGEADAGVVYVTDARAAGDKVARVDLPAVHDVIARYPIAEVTDAPNAAGAREFVAFVQSAEGQRILAGRGFLPP